MHNTIHLTLCANTFLDIYQEYSFFKNKKIQKHDRMIYSYYLCSVKRQGNLIKDNARYWLR